MDMQKLAVKAREIKTKLEEAKTERSRDKLEKSRSGNWRRVAARKEKLKNLLTIDGECYLDVWQIKIDEYIDSPEFFLKAEFSDSNWVAITFEPHCIQFHLVNSEGRNSKFLGSIVNDETKERAILVFQGIAEKARSIKFQLRH